MPFLGLPSVGGLTLDITNFLTANPALVHEIGGHALAHLLYSHIRRSAYGSGLSRREIRKASNRKRRWFVDNIIMHHRRLHNRNREAIVNNARNRVLARREALEQKSSSLQNQPQKNHDEKTKWRDAADMKNRGQIIRGRIDSRKLRARSRWLSAVKVTTD